MTDSLILDLPAVTLDGSIGSSNLNRKAYDLFADLDHGGVLPYGYKQLTGDSVVIDKILRSWQPLGATPSNSEGRVTLFVDPNQMFDKEVEFVGGVEDGHPRALLPAACIEWTPSSRPPFLVFEAPLIGPFAFKKGWRLCVAPEVIGGSVSPGALQAFFGASIQGWGGLELDTNVIHAMPLTGSATWAAGPAPSYRGIIPVKTGGNRFKCRFASKGDGLSIAHASVGIRTGSAANMVAAPIQLTFAGNAGLTLAANSYQECDDASIIIPDNSEVVVDVNVSGNWAFKLQAGASSGVRTCWTNTASWNSANQIGTPTLQAGRLHCVDWAKVWTP